MQGSESRDGDGIGGDDQTYYVPGKRSGALENTTRAIQEEIQGIHAKVDQTSMAVQRNHEMFEAIMARLPPAPVNFDKCNLRCWPGRFFAGCGE